MGQDFSRPLIPTIDPDDSRPKSILECVDGFWQVDRERLILYEEREDEEIDALTERMLSMLLNHQSIDDFQEGEQEPKKRRTVVTRKKQPIMYTDDDGNQRRLDCRQTYWYNYYIKQPNPDDVNFQKKFRKQ